MVVGYIDAIDGCTNGSVDRITDKQDVHKNDLKDNGEVQENQIGQIAVPEKILDICCRTTTDKDQIAETVVDVSSSCDESTAECYSSSDDESNALDTFKNNQVPGTMTNELNDCKDFWVAKTVNITNNYQKQTLDVEQLKYLADECAPKISWTDGFHNESIGKAQDVVSHRLRKAVAIGLSTLTLVLVVIVVAVELWQLNRTEAVIDTDNQCEDIPLNFSIRYVDRQEWFARDSKTPLQKFPSLPLKAVIVDTTGSFSCSTHFYCPNAVLELQNRAIAGGQQDIPANFVLVEDGYIYEGRGWEFVGEDVPGYDSTFLEVLILGNFDITFPTCSNKSLPLLLNEGVRLGFLSPNYELFGKNQFVDTLTMNTDSPLVKDMKNWSRNSGQERDDEDWIGDTKLVTRKQWAAENPQPPSQLLAVIPPKMVVLAHTAGRTCPTDKQTCMDFMRLIQAGHISLGWVDIAYNFLVGIDGVVYVGVGWNRQGHHSLDRNNNKSIAIGFIGNFNKVEPTPGQMKAAKAVLDVGLKLGKIDPDAYVVLHCQIRPIDSPGLNVDKIVEQEWPQWSPLGDIEVETPKNFSVRYFNRSAWFAADPKTPFTKQPNLPLQSVIVYRTRNFNVSHQRNSIKTTMELQKYYQNQNLSDVPSNFLISVDGCIFEGHGWDYVAENTIIRFNSSFLFALRVELVFSEISNSNSSQILTPEMNTSLTLLLEESVKMGKLTPKHDVQYVDDNHHDVDIFGPTAPANITLVPRQTCDLVDPKSYIDKYTHLHPSPTVVVAHTVTSQCFTREDCCQVIRNIQSHHMGKMGWSDIGYHFLVGGDGRVYEGKKWDKYGIFLIGYNCGKGRLVTRTEWGALEPKTLPADLEEIPPQIVIVASTNGPNCATESECREIVQNFQISAMSRGASDILFNFLVGGDCNIYEGVGWNKTGNHTISFNEKSIGLAFIGTFMTSSPAQAQVDSGLAWLEGGVQSNNLAPDYVVFVQKQVTPFESPGVQMIPFIKRWKHWSANITVTPTTFDFNNTRVTAKRLKILGQQ
ncbi:hypothetical protein GE061_002203 [Apolygus lucorum]|uniref:Peptidoglycan recognition protein family domain-containing protein n=1 Tax=Apolygus lucorum TaxID=248454 RepID=A0A8S9X661_APOLU|nr:hypothetical protein GE061_002203 [Apolygus lucorum]